MIVQEMSNEDCREALSNASLGRLACARDNQPYIVPIHFALEDGHIYAFSLPGQKLEWMRNNPHVCLQIDSVERDNVWLSVVAFGCYEELPDTQECRAARSRAHALLRERPMWWEPGALTVVARDPNQGVRPIYYRISMDHLTGRRALPSG